MNRIACMSCCSLATVATGNVQELEIQDKIFELVEYECQDCYCIWAE